VPGWAWCLAVSLVGFAAESTVRFEPNHGQTAEEVRFLSSGGESTIFLTDTETVYRSRDGAVRWSYPGASTARLESRVADSRTRSYRRGRDASKWVDDVPTFREVVRKDVWPGIDIVYHGSEYDFVVAPGADPSRIRIRFGAGTKTSIAPNGALTAEFGEAKYRHRIPAAYTIRGGVRTEVEARFRRIGPREFGVAVGRYDRTAVLTIDPEVRAFTRVGGRGDDELISYIGGSTWIGTTTSPEFPSVGGRGGGDRDILLVSGAESFVIGGSGDDIVHGFSGNYVVGETTSRDLPVSWTDPRSVSFRTSAPPQELYGGGSSDGFVLVITIQFNRFVTTGLTYWGGSGADRLKAVRAAGGGIFMAGESDSTDLLGSRVTGESNRGKRDAALLSITRTDGTTLLFSFPPPRLLGGSGDDFVSGMETTVAEGVTTIHVLGETESPELGINGLSDGLWISFPATGIPAGNPFTVRTVGGSGRDRIVSLAADGSQLLLAGDTTSPDIPDPAGTSRNHAGGWDWMLLSVDSSSGAIRRRTYLGGSGDERLRGMNRASDGSVSMVGATDSADLPVRGAVQEVYGGGVSDAVFARVDSRGAIGAMTYLGGEGRDEALSVCAVCGEFFVGFAATPATGSPSVFGITNSTDWRVQSPSGGVPAPLGGLDAFAISLPVDAEAATIYAARDLPGVLTVTGPANSSERLEGRVTSEDPALVQVAAGRSATQGGASAIIPLLTQSPRTGEAALISPGVEGETFVRVEVPGVAPSRVRVVSATARISARITPDAAALVENGQYRFQPLVQFLRGGAVVSEATAFPLPLDWRVESLAPEVAVATFVERVPISYAEPLRLTINGPGTARFRVSIPGIEIDPYEFAIVVAPGRLTARVDPFVPGLSTTGITISSPALRANRTLTITSSNPEAVAVGRTNALIPAPGSSVGLTIAAGQTSAFFAAHALSNEGQATLSIESAGEPRIDIPVQIAPAVAGFAPVAGTEIGVDGAASLPIAVTYINPATGDPAFPPGRLASLRGNVRIDFKLGTSDESTAVLSTRDGFLTATNISAPSIRGVAAGTAVVEMVEATNVRVDPARSRHEVRVRGSREWRPGTVVVGEQLMQDAVFALPFERADLVRGFLITSEAPTIAGILFPNSLQPVATQSQPGPSPIVTIRVAGIAAGEATLRIEVPGKEPLRVPVRVTKTTATFASREQSIASWQGATPIVVRFAVFDESTGRAGPVQERWMRTVLPGFTVTGDSEFVRIAPPSLAQPTAFLVTPLKAGRTELRLVFGEQLRGVETGSNLPLSIIRQPLNVSSATVGAKSQVPYTLPSPNGGPITLRSSDPSRLVLSTSENAIGGESVALRQGQGIYLQAIGEPGVVRVLVDAGECCESSDLIVEIVQPRWEWAEASSTRALNEPYDLFPRAGAVNRLILWSRAPGLALPTLRTATVSFRSSDSAVALVSEGPIRLSYDTVRPSAEFSVQTGRLGAATISAEMPAGMDSPRPLRVRVPAPRIRLVDMTLSRNTQVQLPINGNEIAFPLRAPLTLTFASLDPSRLLLSASATVPGSATVTVQAAQAAMEIPAVFAQALAGEGSARVLVSAEGYEPSEATVTFNNAVFLAMGPAPSSPLELVRGVTFPFTIEFVNQNRFPQPIRPGVQIPVRLVSSNPSVVRVREQSAFLSQSQPEAKIQVEAIGVGSAELRMENDAGLATNFQSTVSIRVRTGPLTVGATDRYIPQFMARQIRVTIPVPASSGGSTTLTATSLTPLLLSVSAGDGGVAGDSAVLTPPPGAANASFTVHALAPAGVGRIRVSSDTFDSAEIDLTLIRPSLGLFVTNGPTPLIIPATGGPVGLNVVLGGDLDSSFYTSTDIYLSPKRPSVTPVVQTSNPAAGSLSTPSRIDGGARASTLTFTPASPGITTLTVQQPPGFVLAPRVTSLLVRVDPVAGYLFNTPADIDVGQYLSKEAVFAATFPQSPSGGTVPVTISSSDPARLLTSLELSGTASAATQINARAGAPTVFRVTALAGQGTAQLTFSAPGFVPRTTEVRFAPSGLAFPASTSAPAGLRLNESLTLNASWFRLDRSTRALVEATEFGIGVPLRQPSLLISNPNVIAVDGSHALTGAGVQFRLKAIGRGTSDVTIVQPSGFTEPASGTTLRITVP